MELHIKYYHTKLSILTIIQKLIIFWNLQCVDDVIPINVYTIDCKK